MAFVRLLVMLLAVLTVVYFCVSIYSRMARREKLEREFELERLSDPSISPAEKDEFVKRGMVDYDGSLRKRLILLVYVVPLAVIGTIIYTVNHM
ncbi:hypothetical protein AADZ90_001185 [Aestuariibius sp. 2305UL40-4]|uniref:hypothetical protein n=1 Tax=Aestuariibius violaceus TaxID=3234132 RepID=UPI00345EBF37